jgi:hypothetical protein
MECSAGTLAGHDSPATRRERVDDQPFRVVGLDGATLGQFFDLSTALVEFNRRDDATAISLGSYVVTQRAGGVA